MRQAIAIAVDYEEFISIFANGRGIAAQSPIPPGIFGYREGEAGINPYVYDWVDGAPKRKSIDEAKQLLAEAGYPNGVDAQTSQPLVIHLDTTSSGVGDKSRLDWLRKQFDKIDVQLVCAAPTTTASRTRYARVICRCSTMAGMPIIPIRRISCSC